MSNPVKNLDASEFFRINRKLILHSDSIESMYSYSRSRMKLLLSPPFPEDVIVSTDRTLGFRQWLTVVPKQRNSPYAFILPLYVFIPQFYELIHILFELHSICVRFT